MLQGKVSRQLKSILKTNSKNLYLFTCLVVVHVCNCHLTPDEDWMSVEIDWVKNV